MLLEQTLCTLICPQSCWDPARAVGQKQQTACMSGSYLVMQGSFSAQMLCLSKVQVPASYRLLPSF